MLWYDLGKVDIEIVSLCSRAFLVYSNFLPEHIKDSRLGDPYACDALDIVIEHRDTVVSALFCTVARKKGNTGRNWNQYQQDDQYEFSFEELLIDSPPMSKFHLSFPQMRSVQWVGIK